MTDHSMELTHILIVILLIDRVNIVNELFVEYICDLIHLLLQIQVTLRRLMSRTV